MEMRAVKAYVQLSEDHLDPFNINQARMFVIDKSKTIWVVSSHADVYEALEQIQQLEDPKLQSMTHLGVETTGWAAPVDTDNDDIAPSMHSQRRRCRLVAVVDRNLEVASCLGFSDSVELVTDKGNARGALDDAIKECMAAIVYQQATKN